MVVACLAFCLFVSICNVWGQKTSLSVTDRDERLGTAGLSKSVTFRGLKNGLLLQIKTFVGGGNGDDGSFVRCGGDGSV